MKTKILLLFAFFLLPISVFAHGLERVAPTVELGGFQFAFESYPQFPVVGRETHLEFSFSEKLPNNFAVKINGQIFPAEKELSGFDLHRTFKNAGEFSLIFILDGREFPSELSIKINALGIAGWWRIGFLSLAVLFLLLGIFAERRHAHKINHEK